MKPSSSRRARARAKRAGAAARLLLFERMGMTNDRDADRARIVDAEVTAALADGRLIADMSAFRRALERQVDEHVRLYPGWIDARVARIDGRGHVTCCRETRGSHGIDHVYDSAGTDTPPPWWNLDEAKAIARARTARR